MKKMLGYSILFFMSMGFTLCNCSESATIFSISPLSLNTTLMIIQGDINDAKTEGIVISVTLSLIPSYAAGKHIINKAGKQKVAQDLKRQTSTCRCKVGEAFATSSYNLGSRWTTCLIHVIFPGTQSNRKSLLEAAHTHALKKAEEQELCSIVFSDDPILRNNRCSEEEIVLILTTLKKYCENNPYSSIKCIEYVFSHKQDYLSALSIAEKITGKVESVDRTSQ